MMYSEFIEKTHFDEKYISFREYADYIEPAYMAAPNSITKDIFCKGFYKLHCRKVTEAIDLLIAAKTTDEKLDYINGITSVFDDIEMIHTQLKKAFLIWVTKNPEKIK